MPLMKRKARQDSDADQIPIVPYAPLYLPMIVDGAEESRNSICALLKHGSEFAFRAVSGFTILFGPSVRQEGLARCSKEKTTPVSRSLSKG